MTSTTSLKLPDTLKARIESLAASENMTAHAYMVETLDRATQVAERRREFLESARKSKAAFDRDGVGYAHDDVVRHFKAKLSGAAKSELKPIKRSRTSR